MAAFLSRDIAERIGLDYNSRILFEVERFGDGSEHGPLVHYRDLPRGYYTAWFAYTSQGQNMVIIQRRTIAKTPQEEYFVRTFSGENVLALPAEKAEAIKMDHAKDSVHDKYKVSREGLEKVVLPATQ